MLRINMAEDCEAYMLGDSALDSADSLDCELFSDRKFCKHCNTVVSKSTYYRHREEYFDPVTRKWLSSEDNEMTNSCEMMTVNSCNNYEIGRNESNKPLYFDCDLDSEVIMDDGITNCTFEDGFDNHEDATTIAIQRKGII